MIHLLKHQANFTRLHSHLKSPIDHLFTATKRGFLVESRPFDLIFEGIYNHQPQAFTPFNANGSDGLMLFLISLQHHFWQKERTPDEWIDVDHPLKKVPHILDRLIDAGCSWNRINPATGFSAMHFMVHLFNENQDPLFKDTHLKICESIFIKALEQGGDLFIQSSDERDKFPLDPLKDISLKNHWLSIHTMPKEQKKFNLPHPHHQMQRRL